MDGGRLAAPIAHGVPTVFEVGGEQGAQLAADAAVGILHEVKPANFVQAGADLFGADVAAVDVELTPGVFGEEIISFADGEQFCDQLIHFGFGLGWVRW